MLVTHLHRDIDVGRSKQSASFTVMLFTHSEFGSRRYAFENIAKAPRYGPGYQIPDQFILVGLWFSSERVTHDIVTDLHYAFR
jgi:hypothetical protein